MSEQKRSLGSLTSDELKQIIHTHNMGGEIDYDVKHVYGELLFRDMMVQWQEDEPEYDDDGCGHDQNDNYGKED